MKKSITTQIIGFLFCIFCGGCYQGISPYDFKEASWYSEDPKIEVSPNENYELYGTMVIDCEQMDIKLLFGPGRWYIDNETVGNEENNILYGSYTHLNDDHDFKFTIDYDEVFHYQYESFIIKMEKL